MATLSSRSNRIAAAALALLYVAVYLLPLGVRPLAHPDEVRYGAISHEMLVSGDWVSPRFNGVRYFEKPIFGYWLNSASMSVFGENPFALRLPSALAAGLTAFIIFVFARRFTSETNALAACAIYLSTFLVAGIGTFAIFDTYLTFFLTGALASYFLSISESNSRPSLAYAVACGAFCAGAFLTKGFLGLAIPVIVAGPYALVRRQWRTLFLSPWVPALVAVGLVLPWAVLIHLREPDFWNYFFWVEHIQRFASENAQHAESFWYYLRYLPFAAVPWIWMLPAAIAGLRAANVNRAFFLFLVCWVVLPLLFFSLARGKLMTYVLPCFPALSILLAIGLSHYLGGRQARWWRVSAGLLALVLGAVCGGLILVQAGALAEPLYQAHETVSFVVAVVCLSSGVGAALYAAGSRQPARQMASVVAVGIAIFLPFQLAMPQAVLARVAPDGYFKQPRVFEGNPILVADSSAFGVVAWYSKRDDIYLMTPSEIDYGLSYSDSQARRLGQGGLAQLIGAGRNRQPVVIVCKDSTEADIQSLLPAGVQRDEIGGLVILRIPAD